MEELVLLPTDKRNRNQSQNRGFSHRSNCSAGTQRYPQAWNSVPGDFSLGRTGPDIRRKSGKILILFEDNSEILLWCGFGHRTFTRPQFEQSSPQSSVAI